MLIHHAGLQAGSHTLTYRTLPFGTIYTIKGVLEETTTIFIKNKQDII